MRVLSRRSPPQRAIEFGTKLLLPWQQESRAKIFENDTVRRYLPDNRTFIESVSLFVFTHVDEDESVLGYAAVNMDVEMHVRKLQQASHPQIIEGGIGFGD